MKEYRKTATLVVLEYKEDAVTVRNTEDTEELDVWDIPLETFEATYVKNIPENLQIVGLETELAIKKGLLKVEEDKVTELLVKVDELTDLIEEEVAVCNP